MNDDRRRFERLELNKEARVKLDGDWLQAPLKDVSLKGLAVECPRANEFRPGDYCVIELPLSDGEHPVIHMETEVMHVEDNCVGFRWSEIDGDSFVYLKNLLEYNFGDPAQIMRELNNLSKKE